MAGRVRQTEGTLGESSSNDEIELSTVSSLRHGFPLYDLVVPANGKTGSLNIRMKC